MKGKKVIITAGIIVVILMLLFSLFTSLVKNVDNSVSQLSPEQRRSASYHVLEDKDAIVEDTDDNLTFSAFFTRNDESGTDKAQQVDGTCNKINSKDTLFLHLNLKDSGTLKNGKITITGNNFDYSMFMVKNDVLKESYLSDDVTEILLEDIKPGTDEIIFGDVISDIADNINNYSRQSTITLTGDYAKDGEEETVSIKKECNITVDWYGDIKAELKASKHTYYYDNRTSNKITFGFYVNETIKELLLGDVIATAEIPKLNGQDPVTAECTDSTIVDEYNSETRILTMKRSSTLDDEGNITKTLSRQNYFTVTVTYPDEAFENFDTYTQLQVKVNGKYTGYNNPNDEFVKKDESSDEDKEDTESSGDAQDTNKINLVESNLAEGVIILEFTETPEAEAPAIYSNKFSVSILNKIYVSRPSYRYIMSKQDILNLYDNNVENIENFKYTVRWQAYSGNADEIDSYIMTETKSSNETDPYGDKFDSAVIDEYTSNTGIYFFNATTALGEDGKILVYDDDSNQLLYTFTKDNWDSYNENTVFGYDTPVKHIRIETSKPLENEYLYVYHTKEIDTEKLIQKYSFEDMKAVSKLNTYLTGVANLANENKKTTNTYDDVYLVSETSQAKISVEQEKIQTQDTTNQEIYIETIHSQQGDSYWKNGQFIVELPDNIVKLDINKVTIDKQGVEVVAYEAYKKDGRYLIKIMTKNNEPTTYKITIDCDITPDSRIATKDEIITLYAYNENCNEYYSHVPDKYDVDNDIINDEEVGTANCKMRLIAPTSLITLETISDYDAEQNGEITIAPNVADVDKDERQAKINISLTNSYPFPVTGIKILGRIPFKDNKYIVNNKVDMKSEFDTIMVDGGIKATDNEILSKMKVYYTANPNPTQELTNQDNGWQELGEDDDFSKVKCYLIDLQDYTITNNKKVDLNYDVSLPEGIAYNQVSYSNHAVYFDFVTDGGKIPLYAEPAKVGVKIVDKFDLKLIKHKINSDLKIPGVTYSLNYQEEDTEGELQDKTRIITTRQDGSVTVEDLHADVDYTLKEIQVPDTCELSTEEFTFKIDKDGKLTYKGNNGTAVFDGSDVLTIELSDEIKANLQITKTKIGSSEQKINNVRFALIDDEGNKKTDSTKNGTLTFTGLSLNKKYTLTETSVPGGIALNTGKYEFKLIRETESGNIVIHNEGESSLISGNATITEEKDVLTPTMSVSVQDELRYSLDLTKVDDSGNLVQGVQFVLKGEGQKEEGSKYTTTKSGKINITGLHVGAEYTLEEVKALGYYLDNKEEHKITFKVTRNGKLEISKMEEEGIQFDGAVSISEVGLEANISLKLKNDKIPTYNLNIIKKNDNGDTLAGAQFKLRSEDTGIEQYITIDDEGNGTFKDLYEYIPDKYITGKYVLTETYAPEGYKLNPAEVKFFAQRNKDTGKLELTLEKDGGIASVVVEDENGESEEDGESKVDLENKTENEDEQETEAEGKTETNTESNTDPKDEKEDSNSENELKDVETLKISIVNEPIFNLIKLGDEDKPLPGATFTITKINEDDTETPAQTVDGTVLGEIKTDANGKISANLPEGFYKAVETEAPEGYLLPDDENERTYYFGIDMSKPAETSGQLDTVEWARSVSSDYVTKFKSAVKTSDGGVIAVGSTDSSTYIPGVGAKEGYGNTDGLIVKYNSDGSIEWSKIIGGEGEDELLTISADSQGQYYAIGGYVNSSSLNYDGKEIEVTDYGRTDGFVMKISDDGTDQWSKTIGGKHDDRINAVTINDNGDVAVTGSFKESITFDNGTSSKENTLTGTLGTKDFDDGFICVFSDNGNYSWSKSFTSTSDAWGNAITSVADGFVVGVNFAGTLTIQDHTPTIASKGKSDSVVIKYDSSGTYKWVTQVGSSENDEIYNIIEYSNLEGDNLESEDSTDNGSEGSDKKIVVVGAYGATLNIVDSQSSTTSNALTTKGVYDGMIIKLQEDGKYEKAISVGGTGDDVISSIIQTQDGGLLFGGWQYSSNMKFNGGTEDIFKSNYSGVNDGFVIKLSPDDEMQWSDAIKGTSYDIVNSVVQAEDGSYYAIGQFQSKSLTSMGKSDVLSNSTSYDPDAFIIKYAETVTDPAIPQAKEIVVKNDIKQYNITTEIGENAEGRRSGGSITGSYNGEYPESNNKMFVEKVKYGKDNQVQIDITPMTDYSIAKITINEKEVILEKNDDGSVTIEAGYFEDVKEDIHIVVVFANNSHTLTIEKVGNENEPVEGAEFEIVSNNETPSMEEIKSNGLSYTYADIDNKVEFTDNLNDNGEIYATPDKEKEVQKAVGDIKNNNKQTQGKVHTFENKNDGVYTSDNSKISSSTAYAYFEIDLQDKPEKEVFQVSLMAKVESERNCDWGYATINESQEDVEDSVTEGRFVHISGETEDVKTEKEYISKPLTGGKKYYLHIGYKKDSSNNGSGTDSFTVRDIKVYESNANTYYFEKNKENEENNKYIPNNLKVQNTIASTYIPINLEDEGKYAIVINAINKSSSNEYLYAHITTDTNRTTYDSTNGKIMSIQGSSSSTAKDYELLIDGGQQYYLHLGYNNVNVTETEETVAINSITVCKTKELSFDFTKETKDDNTSYVSNNNGRDNTYAYSYIPLNLTNYYGDYELTVNASIAGTSNDYGFVTVKTDTTQPTYSATANTVLCITGNSSNQQGKLILAGGIQYYIHLGYYNSSTTTNNADTFTINKIEVQPVVKRYTATTNADGIAAVEVQDLGKYIVKETHAPEHYILSEEEHPIELHKGDHGATIKITNTRNPLVIVHHYLKDENGNKTKQSVADDEIKEGKPGESYKTEPKKGLEGLNLERVEGEYVLPNDYMGTYPDKGTIEVTYYYEANPIKLTIHHYVDGTEERVMYNGKEVADEVKYTKSKVTFDKDGYTVSASDTYDLDNNDNYENLIETDYDFTSVTTENEDENGISNGPNQADISEVYSYSTDSEITYYYKLKNHIITTEVIEHPEKRTDELSKEKVDVMVDGGIITGYYTDDYPEDDDVKFVEEVEQKHDSLETIKVTPNNGYRVKYVKVKTTTDDGDSSEQTLYDCNDATDEDSGEIGKTGVDEEDGGTDETKENEEAGGTDVTEGDEGSRGDGESGGKGSEDEGSDEEDNLDESSAITLQTFKSVTANKHITTEFEPLQGKVKVHHIILGEGKDDEERKKNGTEQNTTTLTDYVNEPYTTGSIDIPHYMLVSNSSNTEGKYTKEQIDVYYYYDIAEYTYRVEYYYDGKIDNTVTEYHSAEYGETITQFNDKGRDGYILYQKDPVDSDDKVNLQITDDPNHNVIKIYYRSQYNITTEVIPHDEEYSDGHKDTDVKGGSISGDSTDSYEKVLKGDSNTLAITITPASEYRVVNIWATYGEDDRVPISYTDLINDDGVVTIPKDYFKNIESNIHIQVEFRRKTKVIVKYLEKANGVYTNTPVLDELTIDGYEGKNYSTSRKDVTFYKPVEDDKGDKEPTNATGVMKADTITVIYYYERIPAGVTVKYLEKIVNEQGEEEGIAIDGVDNLTLDGYLGLKYDTERKQIDNYVSTTPPQMPDDKENLVYVDIDKDEYSGVYTDKPVEIVYWYERQFYITTEVKAHTENRTNRETGIKEPVSVEGGDITGKGEKPFETVIYNRNAKNEITITPKENYIIKSITLVSTNRDDVATETIIYGKGAVKDAEITYTKNSDGTVTLGKCTNVQENKHIIVEFEPLEGNVVVHHYIAETGEEFYLEAVRVPSKVEGQVVEDETYTDLIGEPYTTSPSKEIASIYELVEVSGKQNGEFENGTIDVYYYYDFKGYEYRIEYYYDGEIDDSETEKSTAKYGDKIITYDDKIRTGYKFDKVEPLNSDGKLELTISDNPEDNVIRVYYVRDEFEYRVEYYYDGIIDPDNTVYKKALYNDEITTYEEKSKPGYTKVGDENNPLIVSDDVDKNVIKVYYRSQYNITTKVLKHTEEYVDGTVKENVKGGTISGDSSASYEKVLKGENSKKSIVIKPEKDYEIVLVTISDGAGSTKETLDYSKYVKDGVVTIPAGYFTNMQSDKHIEVEFRKKSKVIVKYLEKTEEGYTEFGLLPQDELEGYESKEYSTARKNIENYRAVEDKEGNVDPKNAKGTMKADTIEVIYYYEKIPAGVIVKHLEKITDADGNVEGVEIDGVEDEILEGYLGKEYKTSRKTIDNYVSAEPPKLDDSVKNVVYVDKDKDSLDGKYTKDSVEIVYWYERQFHITTEVKPHPRRQPQEGDEPDTVKGGSISGDITAEETLGTPYEDVVRSQDNSKSVEIVPDDGYRVKELVINGEVLDITELEDEDHNIVLPEGYFKDIQDDIHIQVEFEQIPATLVVKYVDADTNEDIIPTEQTDGFVNDEYSTERKDIENYISAEPEPENAKGKLVEDGVTVTYYYTRQFRITTDVIEHYELENKGVIDVKVDKVGKNTSNGTSNEVSNEASGNNSADNIGSDNLNKETNSETNSESNSATEGRILVKGGTISGEDEQPYEFVNRGKDNKKAIEIVPNEGYKIKSIRIRQPGVEIENVDLEDNKSVTLTAGYFTNMQSDKHIEVEFEKIPAKLTVEYLDKDTQEKVSKSEIVNGYVNDEYKTHEKELKYYELMKDEYPDNAEGKLEEDTHVTYWYRKLLFNMRLTKELASVQVNGNEVLEADKKLVKVDITNTAIDTTNILVKYKITVTNTEEVAGAAKVLEQIPVGFKPSSQMKTIKAGVSSEEQMDNTNEAQVDTWLEVDSNLELTTRELQPGETAEYEVILEWDTSKKIIGNLENIAKITQTQNIPQFAETTQDDNNDSCTVLISIRTGQNRNVKTIISISCFALAGICAVVYVGTEMHYRRKH